ncbi:hypothetical protein CRX72_15445 [Pantoea sp. BRM17]|nr:hypothetical protein CRX72_15445 [Pantoea sp. BRM17]
MSYFYTFQNFLAGDTALAATVSLLLLVAAAMIAHFICKFFVVKVVRKVFFSATAIRFRMLTASNYETSQRADGTGNYLMPLVSQAGLVV